MLLWQILSALGIHFLVYIVSILVCMLSLVVSMFLTFLTNSLMSRKHWHLEGLDLSNLVQLLVLVFLTGWPPLWFNGRPHVWLLLCAQLYLPYLLFGLDCTTPPSNLGIIGYLVLIIWLVYLLVMKPLLVLIYKRVGCYKYFKFRIL